MSKLVGYARVSTKDQNLSSQIDGLKKVGCKAKYIFSDKIITAKQMHKNHDMSIDDM
jgi:DNA invertase Pin-like site-specific DNA recombinase